MQSLEVLKRKIKTSEDLLSVVKTMKSLAAVNIQQLEGAVAALTAFAEVNQTAWRAYFRVPGPLRQQAGEATLLLAFGSDQGMCGQFNEAVAEQVLAQADALRAEGKPVAVMTIGERVLASLAEPLKQRRIPLAGHEHLPGGPAAIGETVQNIVLTLAERQESEGAERIQTVANTLRGRAGYETVSERLLPLDEEWAEHVKSQGWERRCLPLLGQERATLFHHLFDQHLFISLYKALGRSMAAENSARLTAMQAAEKNIEELREEIMADYRDVRQATITAELLDVVTGFTALEDG